MPEPEELPQIDVKEFRKTVMTRRSVRKFDDTPIPEEVLQDCLDMALLAPNSSNLQPWEFYIVRSPDKREKIIEACFNQNAAKTADKLVAFVARTDTWGEHGRGILEQWPDATIPKIVQDYYGKKIYIQYRSGPLNLFGLGKWVVSSIMGLRRPMARWPLTHADMKLWAAKTCALAAENYMLALRAYGFDSCPMEGFDSKRLHQILALPKDGFVVMLVAAGKRSPKGVYQKRFRFPREQFIKEV
ncbi:MAG: nitroreductase family protein [SAR324 cluster bacterium]|nr:nitroreductase family protein [SAR324 cluster bacterium]